MGKTGANVLIQREAGQTKYEEELTSSDNQIFTGTGKVWSGKSGFSPSIIPDGIASGTNIFSPTTTNNEVEWDAFTAYVGNELKTVAADSATITRASTDTHIQNAFVYDGSSMSVIQGSEGTSFSSTPGAAGGPPYIPVGSILCAIVKTNEQAAAVIDPAELFQSANDNTQERFDYPLWGNPINLGYGKKADSAAEKKAHIKFNSALPLIHTGDTAKKVYGNYYDVVFADIDESDNWVPATSSPSVSSKQIYRKTTATASFAINAASFTMYVNDSVADPFRALEGETLTFRTYQ